MTAIEDGLEVVLHRRGRPSIGPPIPPGYASPEQVAEIADVCWNRAILVTRGLVVAVPDETGAIIARILSQPVPMKTREEAIEEAARAYQHLARMAIDMRYDDERWPGLDAALDAALALPPDALPIPPGYASPEQIVMVAEAAFRAGDGSSPWTEETAVYVRELIQPIISRILSQPVPTGGERR